MRMPLEKYFKSLYSSEDDKRDVIVKSVVIMLVFSITVITVYLLPVGLSRIFFLIIFILFWYSKTNYFWFAFFLIISFNPAGFFQETSSEIVRRLPLLTVLPRVSFSVMDLFLIISVIKAFIKGKKRRMRDELGIRYIFYFALFLSFITLFHGLTLKTFISQPLRGMFFYTIFFSFPALVSTKKEIAKFLYLFFPFVLLELFSQGYVLYTGDFLQNSLFPGMELYVYRDKLMEDSIRSLAPGYSIVVMSFMFGLILYDSVDRMTSRVYIVIIMVIGSLSMLISATRQSILMFALMFLLYVIFVLRNKRGFLLQMSIIALFLFFFFDYLNVLDLNFTISAVFNRLTGAVQIQNGSLEAEDTLDFRLSYRLPLLWGYIKQSLMLGYGYSDLYFKYYDGHLGGILVAMLQAGLSGLAFYTLFVIKIYKVTIYYIKKFGDKITVTITLKSLLVGITGFVFLNTFINPMLVLNFTSRPQEFFIVLVLLYQFLNFGKVEYILRKRAKETIKKKPETADVEGEARQIIIPTK